MGGGNGGIGGIGSMGASTAAGGTGGTGGGDQVPVIAGAACAGAILVVLAVVVVVRRRRRLAEGEAPTPGQEEGARFHNPTYVFILLASSYSQTLTLLLAY